MRLIIFNPVVFEPKTHGLIHKNPRAIFDNNMGHRFIFHRALRRVLQGADRLIEPINFSVSIVGMIGSRRFVFAVEELEKVFRIWVVRHPTELEELRLAAVHLFDEGGPGIVRSLQHNTDFLIHVGHQLHRLAGICRGASEFNRQFQPSAGFLIDPFWVPRLGQQAAGFFKIKAIGRWFFQTSGERLGNGSFNGMQAIVHKLVHLPKIVGAAQGLPQLPVA